MRTPERVQHRSVPFSRSRCDRGKPSGGTHVLSGDLIDGHVLVREPTRLILADTGEERLHAIVPASHTVVEVGEDGKVIPVGVDVS